MCVYGMTFPERKDVGGLRNSGCMWTCMNEESSYDNIKDLKSLGSLSH